MLHRKFLDGVLIDEWDDGVPDPEPLPITDQLVAAGYSPEQADAISTAVTLAVNLTAPDAAAALTAAVAGSDALAGVAVLDQAVADTVTGS